MANQLNIEVVTYNGEFLETPKVMQFDCDQIQYVGMYNARTYDANDCIIVRKAFGFLYGYGKDLWQTFDFKSVLEFIEYRDTHCNEQFGDCCLITDSEGCFITYNGKYVTYAV